MQETTMRCCTLSETDKSHLDPHKVCKVSEWVNKLRHTMAPTDNIAVADTDRQTEGQACHSIECTNSVDMTTSKWNLGVDGWQTAEWRNGCLDGWGVDWHKLKKQQQKTTTATREKTTIPRRYRHNDASFKLNKNRQKIGSTTTSTIITNILLSPNNDLVQTE